MDTFKANLRAIFAICALVVVVCAGWIAAWMLAPDAVLLGSKILVVCVILGSVAVMRNRSEPYTEGPVGQDNAATPQIGDEVDEDDLAAVLAAELRQHGGTVNERTDGSYLHIWANGYRATWTPTEV